EDGIRDDLVTGVQTCALPISDVLGQTFNTVGTAKSGNTMTIGLGAQVGAVRQVFNQGSVQTTNNPLDVAIQGKGFLVVKDPAGRSEERRVGKSVDVGGVHVVI